MRKKVKPSTPKDKAKRIARILAGKKGYDYISEAGEDQQAVRDLLTDILHFIAENKLDLELALEGSEEVWREEQP